MGLENYLDESKNNPQAINSLLNIGKLLIQQNKPDAAIKPLKQAKNINPSKECSLLLAQAYQRSGNYTEAIKEYIAINPYGSSNKLIPFNFGLCLLNLGDSANAIRAFEYAIKLDGSFVAAWANISNALMSECRHKEALISLFKLLELDPLNSRAYLMIGSIYKIFGNLDEALVHFKKAIQVNPDIAESYINATQIFIEKGDFSNAISSALKAKEIFPQNPNIYICLGATYYQANELDVALSYTMKALELMPDNSDALMNLGSIYHGQGEFRKALDAALKSVKVNPYNVQSLLNLSEAYRNIHDLQNALAVASKLIKIYPDNCEGYIKASQIQEEIGNPESAAKLIQKALEFNPKRIDLYLKAAVINLEIGEIDKAEILLIESINQGENKSNCYRYLSIINSIKGRLGEAKDCIEKALLLDPEWYENKTVQALITAKCRRKTIDDQGNITKSKKVKNIFPVTQHIPVEAGLVESLYKLDHIDPEKFPHIPTKGNAITSDFSFFRKNKSLFQDLEKSLKKIAQQVVGTDIYIEESWFTVLKNGGNVKKHRHISGLCKIKGFNIEHQRFALVYYLDVGRQDSSNPGYLKFYDPDLELLPSNGMVVIFPGNRYHSVNYDGTSDRIIIGINFWSL